MRILDSQFHGSVDHNSQQDISQLRVVKSQQSHIELDANQQVIATQETINLAYSQHYESEQTSRLYTQSTVMDSNNGTQQTISQEELTRTLVSGVLQHEVHIGDIIYASTRLRQNVENTSFMEELALTNELNLQEDFPQDIQGDSSDGIASTTDISINQLQVDESTESLKLISEGEISIADGRKVSFRLELDLESNYTEITRQQLSARSQELIDPLVISLDGRAPSLSNSTFNFDIDSNGVDDKLSQLASGAGFLAFDQNNDGVINNGHELFGPQSGNGFQDLSVYDDNQDGWIDESDNIFNQLLVWQPASENGEESLQSLSKVGIGAINLQALESPFELKDEHNNTLGMVQRSGIFLKENGEVGLVQQIDLALQEDVADIGSMEKAFYEQAAQLKQQYKQHVSENNELMLEQAAVDINAARLTLETANLELDVSPKGIDLGEERLPMLIIASHFQVEYKQQETIIQQEFRARNVSIKPYASSPEKTEDTSYEAEPDSLGLRQFNGVSQHDTPVLDNIRNSGEGRESFKGSIIEDVLKPLHEQLKLKRQLVSEAYVKGQSFNL